MGNTITQPQEFTKFHNLLTKNAPEDYVPWYFPVEANDKNPDALTIGQRAPKGITKEQGKYSWKEPHARLTYDEAKQRLSRGGNIGIAARSNDPLVIMDIDHWTKKEQLPNTLTNKSRKRCGWHAFAFTNDKHCKTNIPTEEQGELRASDQYVVAPGSYVTTTTEGIKKEQLPQEMEEAILHDPMLGVYTVENAISPLWITYNDLPILYREKAAENNHKEEIVQEPRTTREGKYTDLFNLRINDVVSVSKTARVSHPLHGSDTGKNFSVSGSLAHCWRHNVSLNPVQYLCVESGQYECNDAGTPHKTGTSKIKGDKKALQTAYEQAIKKGLIKEKMVVHIAADIVEDQAREEIRKSLAMGKWILRGAQIIIKNNPIYFDRTETWWVWNNSTRSWETKDETDIINICQDTLELLGDTCIRHGRKLLDALKLLGRKQQPKELPLEKIQCGTIIYDIITKENNESNPAYFSTNPIPWMPGTSEDTPILDDLITSWIGKELLPTMYEIFAYCLYREYPIHRVFCFVGSGSNGKSRVFKIIDKFLGNENKSSVSLKKLSGNDFAIYPMYRKLICYVGETSHHVLESTEIIKSLSGQDPVSFEAKGKNSFTGYNYAKLFVGTNMLPPSTDNSRGWYRRWFIINFPNEFEEGEDVFLRVTDEEYQNLLTKCLRILPELLKRGNFSTEGTIEDRQAKYIANSNPFKEFLSLGYEREVDSKVRYTELYNEYVSFLASRKLRRITKREFGGNLEDEGLEMQKTSTRELDNSITSYNVVLGLKRLPKQRQLPGLYSCIPNIPVVQVASNFTIGNSTSDLESAKFGNTKHTKSSSRLMFDFVAAHPGCTLKELPGSSDDEKLIFLERIKKIGKIIELPNGHYRVP